MTSTQVISAIRGPQSRAFASIEFFGGRVEECSKLTASVADRYFNTLVSDDDDAPGAESLEALSLLSLGRPGDAAERGIDVVELLLRAAGALERAHEVARAHALLSVGWQSLEQPAALLRAMEHFRVRQRRQTRHVADLLAKADLLWKRGELKRAEEALREVLSIDSKHETAQGMQRAIRAKRAERGRVWKQRSGLLLVAAIVVLMVSALVSYERNAREAFAALPTANSDEQASVEHRLAELERFMERYPVWLGSFQAVEERAQLRVQERLLARRLVANAERVERESTTRRREAEYAYREGRRLAEIGSVEQAMAEFSRALDLAPEDWPRADRVKGDIELLEEMLRQAEPIR